MCRYAKRKFIHLKTKRFMHRELNKNNPNPIFTTTFEYCSYFQKVQEYYSHPHQ